MSFYSQKDPKWAKEKLGSGPDTIGQSGCKNTSFCNLGKEMEWFDYTPQSLNRLMIKEKLYTDGLLIADAVIAKYFGLTTERVKKDPGIVCIAETNYYSKKDKNGKEIGVPQHFFAYEKGMILDPLDPDPKWKKNPYPLVSFRVFKKYKDPGIATSIPVMGETTTTAVPVQNAPNSPKIDAGEANAPEGGTGTPPPEIADSVAPKEMTLKEAILALLKYIFGRGWKK